MGADSMYVLALVTFIGTWIWWVGATGGHELLIVVRLLDVHLHMYMQG